jgi:hypothetical protein
LQGCQKEENSVDNFTTNSQNKQIVLPDERIYTDSQIDTIGVLHNELLEKCFSEFDYTSPSFEDEFFEEFQKYESIYSLQLQELNVRTDNEQMIVEIQGELSTEANVFLNKIIAIAYDFEDVLSFTNSIIAIENNIKSELIGAEIDILLTVTSIMKHSALFWAPENLGGSGIGYSVLQKIEDNYWDSKKPRPRPSLKKVIGEALVADGFSGGVGMLGVAVTVAVAGIISGPAAWAALYVTFGESVISSGITAFLTYFRG